MRKKKKQRRQRRWTPCHNSATQHHRSANVDSPATVPHFRRSTPKSLNQNSLISHKSSLQIEMTNKNDTK